MIIIPIPAKFATDSAVILPRSNDIAEKFDTSFPLLGGGLETLCAQIFHVAVAMSVDFAH